MLKGCGYNQHWGCNRADTVSSQRIHLLSIPRPTLGVFQAAFDQISKTDIILEETFGALLQSIKSVAFCMN